MFRLPCQHVVSERDLENCAVTTDSKIICPECKDAYSTTAERCIMMRQCAICMDHVSRSDKPVAVFPCTHIMCMSCLWTYAGSKVPRDESDLACGECSERVAIWQDTCPRGHPQSIHRLLPCPVCHARIGFGMLQVRYGLKCNAPEVYEKMGAFLKHHVDTAYVRPEIYRLLGDIAYMSCMFIGAMLVLFFGLGFLGILFGL